MDDLSKSLREVGIPVTCSDLLKKNWSCLFVFRLQRLKSINFSHRFRLISRNYLILCSLNEQYGVNVKQQEYFADSPSTGMDPATRDE